MDRCPLEAVDAAEWAVVVAVVAVVAEVVAAVAAKRGGACIVVVDAAA